MLVTAEKDRRPAAAGWELQSGAPPLSAGEVHVWLVPPGISRASAAGLLLSEDEAERARRFRFDRDRDEFTLNRSILRTLLGRYTARDPRSLVFEYNRYGKPFLPGNSGSTVHFNVSHSAGMAIMVFGEGLEVGADVERIRGDVLEEESIVHQSLTRSEAARLRQLDPNERPRWFFECWTRREASLKADGSGFSAAAPMADLTDGPPTADQPCSIIRPPRIAGYSSAVAVLGEASTITFLELG